MGRLVLLATSPRVSPGLLSRDAWRAIESADRSVAPELLEGVELTLRELQNVFGRHGIRVIAPAVGDRFDPQQHEAMFEAPDAAIAKGLVSKVVQIGYKIGERVLRPALVGVSAGAPKPPAGDAASDGTSSAG